MAGRARRVGKAVGTVALTGALALTGAGSCGAATAAAAAPPVGAPICPTGRDLTGIAAVQGRGTSSPLAGRTVRVEGVVTASFGGPHGLGGFVLQSTAGDGDPATSEGLFVRWEGRSAAPNPGDVVRAAGTVREVRGMTELASVTALDVCGRQTPPSPLAVDLASARAGGWEALEGMRVRIARPAVVTGVYDLGRYGELTLAAARLFAPTQDAGGGAGPQEPIVLDDGSLRQDPRPVPYLLSDGRLPRVGDTVAGVTGVVMQSGAEYRLEPVAPPTLVVANPRPESAPRPGGDVVVATFNVHDFFTSLGERGALSTPQYRLQRAKLAAALAGLHADAIALQEVENDGPRSVGALVAALDRRLGTAAYVAAPDPPEGAGTDRIKQAVLYRPGRLRLVHLASDPQPLFERAPVAATFRTRQGRTFTLVAVHLKAKSGCPAAGDVDRGFGCWNLRRSAQARAVLDFARRLQATAQGPDVVVAGDLNSYAAEPPLALFRAAGYVDATRSLPSEDRYSYVYRGLSGSLDYLLVSPQLAPDLAGAGIWHIDADESPLVGADTRHGPQALARPDPYRASDHDPVLAGFRLGTEGAGQGDGAR